MRRVLLGGLLELRIGQKRQALKTPTQSPAPNDSSLQTVCGPLNSQASSKVRRAARPSEQQDQASRRAKRKERLHLFTQAPILHSARWPFSRCSVLPASDISSCDLPPGEVTSNEAQSRVRPETVCGGKICAAFGGNKLAAEEEQLSKTSLHRPVTS